MMDEKKIDERFMREAIRQARKAGALMEVPIGCVIVYEGKIIARGYNRRNTDKNTISHAELNAIRKASEKLGDWRPERTATLQRCDCLWHLKKCQGGRTIHWRSIFGRLLTAETPSGRTLRILPRWIYAGTSGCSGSGTKSVWLRCRGGCGI